MELRKSGWRHEVVAFAVAMLIGTPAAYADYSSDAGFGLLATVSNIAYMPAKIFYAAIGAGVGGMAYLATAGDLDTARGVWSPTMGGDYVLTGSMLRGDEPILFVGPTFRRNPSRSDVYLGD